MEETPSLQTRFKPEARGHGEETGEQAKHNWTPGGELEMVSGFKVIALKSLILFVICSKVDLTGEATRGPAATPPANREPWRSSHLWNKVIQISHQTCSTSHHCLKSLLNIKVI